MEKMQINGIIRLSIDILVYLGGIFVTVFNTDIEHTVYI